MRRVDVYLSRYLLFKVHRLHERVSKEYRSCTGPLTVKGQGFALQDDVRDDTLIKTVLGLTRYTLTTLRKSLSHSEAG